MSDSKLTSREEDIRSLIIAGCHLGGKRVTKQMKRYVYKIREDRVSLFDVNKIYEKIQVAARMIASIPESETVISVSGRQAGQRAVYKFGQLTQTTAVAGRWTPGMLTNQITKKFVEPRLLIVTDPRIDYNALVESSYVNIPVIAICNSDNNLAFVDCAIPCNNRSRRAVAMIYWLLTKAVLTIKGQNLEAFNATLPGAYMFREDKKAEKKEEEQPEEEPAGEDKKDEEGGADDGDEGFLD